MLLVMREVDQVRHLEAEALHDRIDDLGAPLEPAARALHRIEHERPVGVEAQPVVGKHGIGLHGLRGVLHRADADSLALERLLEVRELISRQLARGGEKLRLPVALEGVGGGRFRVVAEGLGPDHQHGIRALRVRFLHGPFSHVRRAARGRSGKR